MVRPVSFLITSQVGEFVKLRSNVKIMDTSEVEFDKERLPAATQTVVLKHAR